MDTQTLDLRIILPTIKKPIILENTSNTTPDFLKKITSYNSVIVFSPHLDDAALSMGSLISYLVEKNIKVKIITVFTEGSPLLSKATRTLLKNANFENADKYFKARRAEDKVALSKLGNVEIEHLGYMDSAWRSDNGIALYEDSQLATIKQEDSKLQEDLILKLKKLVDSSPASTIFAPLARGKHVDHQIVRNVVAHISPQTIFYQDFPYSALFANEDEFITERKLASVEWQGNYEKKKESLLQYVTQRYSLFYRGPMNLPLEMYYLSL